MSTGDLTRILVIDDNAVDRESICRLVDGRYTVIEAATAAEGLQLCRSEQPPCVLLDFRLPDRDGVEIVEHLLAEQVAVIMLTGEGSEKVAVDAMKRGAQDYLVKDGLTSDTLYRSIRGAVERQRLERQMQAAQRMEAVGRLAGGVAHDFNNTLNVILGYGDMLLQELQNGDPLREQVEEIMKAGRHSAALTRQLLAFSRRQALQPEVLDLNAIVEDLQKMLRRLIGEDIDMTMALAEDLAGVEVDPGQIEQVIMNLAINAQHAMPRGGKLLIETANVELDNVYAKNHASVVPGKYVMLAMTDTGCGMDKETLSKIFDPFFTTKKQGEGTGLGLSTVYGIVKQSSGNIWAYSEPGKGTTFKIYFPLTLAKPETKEERIAKEEPLVGGEHILVVEDAAALRQLIERILSRLDYKVSGAASGVEALLLIEQKGLKPDLVITDVIMPRMGGPALVKRLRKIQPDLKVIYMSGYTGNALVQRGDLDRGTPFIQKPFTNRDFIAIIQDVLRRAGAMGPKLRSVHAR